MRTRSVLAFLIVIGGCLVHGAAVEAAPTVITEFYNTNLRHYVLITSPAEVAAIDNGAAGPGWQKTGKTLNAFTEAGDLPGIVPVCRFYGSITPGPNSHFFTADPDECAAVKNDPGWHYEGIAFYVGLPVGGECSSGHVPVWRAYNNGFKPAQGINDGNHRFSVDRASIQKLTDSGWNDEGAVFCAQADNPNVPFVLTASSASLLLLPGTSRDIYVNVDPRNGFNGKVELSAVGLPSGVTSEFLPSSVTLTSVPVDVVMRISVGAGAAPSDSTIVNVKGVESGGRTALAGFDLSVAAAGDLAAARLAAIAAVEQRFTDLRAQNLTPLAVVQALAAFMATFPEYESTGVDEETICAWGQFRDGTLHIVANNLEAPPQGNVAAAANDRVPAKAGAELPADVKARVIHSFGGRFFGQPHVDQIRSYLQAKDWKLRGGPSSEAHVGTLKGAKGDGFFYMNTHGGRGDAISILDPAGRMFAVWTSTVVDPDYERIFLDDKLTLRLVHFTADTFLRIRLPNGQVRDLIQTRYGITHRFVENYMNFVDESVVFMNACSSISDAKFVDAFIKKNAGVYLGWTKTLYADAAFAAAPYFVDRMLGANKHPDKKELIPQRAFPYDLVLADMKKKGLDVDKDSKEGNVLRHKAKAGLKYPPIFAPSIKQMLVNEYDEELTLEGYFGEDKPKVTIGGNARNVKSWNAEKLLVDLPLSGLGSSGDVVVEVRGVKSNAKQLTEWPLQLNYKWTGFIGMAGLNVAGTSTLRFRADVGGYRELPGEDLVYEIIGGPPTKDSSLTLTGSGTSQQDKCLVTLTGSATYVSPTSPAAAAGTVLASGFEIDAYDGTGTLGMALGSFSSPYRLTFSGGESCTASFTVAGFMGQLDGYLPVRTSQLDATKTILLSAANLTTDDDYGINARNLIDTRAGGEIRVHWPLVGATAPPRLRGDELGY